MIAEAFIIGAQVVYWFWLRDEERDEVVWNACIHPERMLSNEER